MFDDETIIDENFSKAMRMCKNVLGRAESGCVYIFYKYKYTKKLGIFN